MAETDRRWAANPIRKMQALLPPPLHMRIDLLASHNDFNACREIVLLNYCSHLMLGNLDENRYLGLFNDENKLVAFVGFCVSPMDSIFYEVFALNTHPDHRNKGYATALLAEVYIHVKYLTNNVRILLTCSKEKESFYQKRNYQTVITLNETCLMHLNG